MGDQSHIVFGEPAIEESEIDEVVACLRSGWLGTGPRVAQFEQNFASYKGVANDRIAAVNSCTAALHVSMVAAELQPGAEVITTPLTFCATINAILHAGLQPVLADVDARSQCIDPAAIEAAITPRTEAIIPVHFAGRPCDMDAILRIASKHGLAIVEDCAHAIETEYRGISAGRFGDFGCFSFYTTKNVVTGEGGMVIGRSEQHIARVKRLALHGLSKDAWHRFSDRGYKHYEVVECGFKYNMMDIQAAIGIHQLARIEKNWARRKALWEKYQTAFADLPLGLPEEPAPDTRHAHHLYTVRIDETVCGMARDHFIAKLHELGIGTGVHYRAASEHAYYQERFGWRPDEWPEAMRIGRETVSLPLSANVSDTDIEKVIAAVRETLPTFR